MGVFGEAGAPMGEIWLAPVGGLFLLAFSGDYESEVPWTGLYAPYEISESEDLIHSTYTKREKNKPCWSRKTSSSRHPGPDFHRDKFQLEFTPLQNRAGMINTEPKGLFTNSVTVDFNWDVQGVEFAVDDILRYPYEMADRAIV